MCQGYMNNIQAGQHQDTVFYALLKCRITLLFENDLFVNMDHSNVSLVMFYFIDKKSISYQRMQWLKN